MKQTTSELRILQFAEEVFLEKGFSAAKTTEIARRAGVNHALVHYYFRSKENLFETIVINKLKVIIQSFSEATTKDMPYNERIILLIDTHFSLFADHPRMPLFLINEFLNNPTHLDFLKRKIKSFPSEVFENFETQTKDAIKLGIIRPINSKELLTNIYSLIFSIFINKPFTVFVFDWDGSDYKAYIEKRKKEITDFILFSLRP
jgi:TetR/AcrR family transcriptional regulator